MKLAGKFYLECFIVVVRWEKRLNNLHERFPLSSEIIAKQLDRLCYFRKLIILAIQIAYISFSLILPASIFSKNYFLAKFNNDHPQVFLNSVVYLFNCIYSVSDRTCFIIKSAE